MLLCYQPYIFYILVVTKREWLWYCCRSYNKIFNSQEVKLFGWLLSSVCRSFGYLLSHSCCTFMRYILTSEMTNLGDRRTLTTS
jgi:hypothetical protein